MFKSVCCRTYIIRKKKPSFLFCLDSKKYTSCNKTSNLRPTDPGIHSVLHTHTKTAANDKWDYVQKICFGPYIRTNKKIHYFTFHNVLPTIRFECRRITLKNIKNKNDNLLRLNSHGHEKHMNKRRSDVEKQLCPKYQFFWKINIYYIIHTYLQQTSNGSHHRE